MICSPPSVNTSNNLKSENSQKIKQELHNYQQQKIREQSKVAEFSEKIDELNQETDTLLEEIDKWQM